MEGINARAIISQGLKIEGFLLGIWLKNKSMWGAYQATRQAKPLIEEVIVNKSFGLHQIHEAIAEYKANMGKGKVLLKPSLT